jgi:hypothetical protein
VVSSFFSADRATLALNSGLYLFLFFLMVFSFQSEYDSELNILSSFWGPPLKTADYVSVEREVSKPKFTVDFLRDCRKT